MPKYYIAGIQLELNSADKQFFDSYLSPYLEPCECPDFDNNNLSDIMKIDVNIVDDCSCNLSNPILENPEMSVFRVDNGMEIYFDKPIARMRVVHDSEYSNIKIDITNRQQDIYRPSRMLEYVYVGTYFAYKLSLSMSMMLHGSAISYNNNGIIFSAPCGTGKSTHSSLWEKLYGDKARVINDDKPIIRFADNVPWVCGTPFCGKSYINQNLCSPLKAIVYLRQAPYNKIQKLDTKIALGLLYEQAIKSIVDPRIIDSSLQCIEKLLFSTPCYILDCLPNFDAVRCVENKLIADGLL